MKTYTVKEYDYQYTSISGKVVRCNKVDKFSFTKWIVENENGCRVLIKKCHLKKV